MNANIRASGYEWGVEDCTGSYDTTEQNNETVHSVTINEIADGYVLSNRSQSYDGILYDSQTVYFTVLSGKFGESLNTLTENSTLQDYLGQPGTVKLYFHPTTCTLTFDYGGILPNSSVSIEWFKRRSFNQAPTPENPPKIFLGWRFITKHGREQMWNNNNPLDSVTGLPLIYGNMTFYAVWEDSDIPEDDNKKPWENGDFLGISLNFNNKAVSLEGINEINIEYDLLADLAQIKIEDVENFWGNSNIGIQITSQDSSVKGFSIECGNSVIEITEPLSNDGENVFWDIKLYFDGSAENTPDNNWQNVYDLIAESSSRMLSIYTLPKKSSGGGGGPTKAMMYYNNQWVSTQPWIYVDNVWKRVKVWIFDGAEWKHT